MNDLEKQLFKQNQEFKELLRAHGFLAQTMVAEGRYDCERQRLDLLDISASCLCAETGKLWTGMFKDKASHVAYQNLRRWWTERHITPRNIEVITREYHSFVEQVEQDRRDRLAGAKRPTLGLIVKQVLAAKP